METTALTRPALQPDPVATLRTVGQKEEDAPSRKRQPPQGQGRPISLPEDRVTLSSAALQEERQPSQPVSPREKAALLGPQNVARFSVYG